MGCFGRLGCVADSWIQRWAKTARSPGRRQEVVRARRKRFSVVTVALVPPSRPTRAPVERRALGAASAVVLLAGVSAALTWDNGRPFGLGDDTQADGVGSGREAAVSSERPAAGVGGRLAGKGGAGAETERAGPAPVDSARSVLASTPGSRPSWPRRSNRPAGPTSSSIWVLRDDGASRTQVTGSDSAYDRFPRWSADGQHLAFTRFLKEQSAAEVYVMDVHGAGLGALQQSPRPPPSTAGRMRGSHPRSRVVAGQPPGRVHAHLRWSVNRRPRRHHRQAPVRGRRRDRSPGVRPSWSPDARSLAFARFDPRHRFGTAGRRTIWAADVTGVKATKVRQLVSGGAEATSPGVVSQR